MFRLGQLHRCGYREIIHYGQEIFGGEVVFNTSHGQSYKVNLPLPSPLIEKSKTLF